MSTVRKKHEINEDMKWNVIIPIHKSIRDSLSDDPNNSNIRRKKICLLKFVFAFFNILAIMLAVVIKSNGGSPQRQSWKIVLYLYSLLKDEQPKRKQAPKAGGCAS